MYASPDALSDRLGSFDVVYVNLGAICWLPDIRGWARVCAAFLKPGGTLYLRDVHPTVNSLDDQAPIGELRLRYPYFEMEQPLHWQGDGDYADSSVSFDNQDSYEWNHGLGEIVSAVIDSGCRLEFLHEQDWTVYPALPWLVETGTGVWRLPERDGETVRRLPLMFSLRATKAATPPPPSAPPSR